MLDRRVELLRMVAHVGTVTAAAHALYRSPSGVSRQIQELAKELGVELLEPEGRRVKLTPAGRTLVDYADATHRKWEETRSALVASEGLSGLVTVVAHPSAVTSLVAPALQALEEQYPGVELRIIEDQPPQSFHRLITTEADICLAAVEEGVPHRNDPRFDQRELAREPIDALMPSCHRLADKSALALRDLAEESWIVPAPGQAGHHEVLTACQSAGFTPSAVHYAREWSTVGTLVQVTGAVSLTSRFAPLPNTGAIRMLLDGDPAPARQLVLATRAGAESGPIVTAMAEVLAAQAATGLRAPEMLSSGQ